RRVGVLDHRHDEPALRSNRHPEIEVVLVDDVVAVDRGVDRGNLVQRRHAGTREERHESEPDAVLLLEAILVLRAQRHDAAAVDLVEGGENGRCVLGGDQPLGDALADAGHRHALFAVACGPGRRTRGRRRRRGRRGRRIDRNGGGRGGGAGGGAGVVRAGPGGARRWRCMSTSPLVSRPPLPEAAIAVGSRPCSSIRFRTAGLSGPTARLAGVGGGGGAAVAAGGGGGGGGGGGPGPCPLPGPGSFGALAPPTVPAARA